MERNAAAGGGVYGAGGPGREQGDVDAGLAALEGRPVVPRLAALSGPGTVLPVPELHHRGSTKFCF